MSTGQYITVRETAQILGISEKKVMDLIEERHLQAYRIADQFLRLNKTEVLQIRNSGNVENENIIFEYAPSERLGDFFYYNDFYILALIVILSLLYVILFL